MVAHATDWRAVRWTRQGEASAVALCLCIPNGPASQPANQPTGASRDPLTVLISSFTAAVTSLSLGSGFSSSSCSSAAAAAGFGLAALLGVAAGLAALMGVAAGLAADLGVLALSTAGFALAADLGVAGLAAAAGFLAAESPPRRAFFFLGASSSSLLAAASSLSLSEGCSASEEAGSSCGLVGVGWGVQCERGGLGCRPE
jgi:hypothetical protein